MQSVGWTKWLGTFHLLASTNPFLPSAHCLAGSPTNKCKRLIRIFFWISTLSANLARYPTCWKHPMAFRLDFTFIRHCSKRIGNQKSYSIQFLYIEFSLEKDSARRKQNRPRYSTGNSTWQPYCYSRFHLDLENAHLFQLMNTCYVEMMNLFKTYFIRLNGWLWTWYLNLSPLSTDLTLIGLSWMLLHFVYFIKWRPTVNLDILTFSFFDYSYSADPAGLHAVLFLLLGVVNSFQLIKSLFRLQEYH